MPISQIGLQRNSATWGITKTHISLFILPSLNLFSFQDDTNRWHGDIDFRQCENGMKGYFILINGPVQNGEKIVC